jgi:hypothetical protein
LKEFLQQDSRENVATKAFILPLSSDQNTVLYVYEASRVEQAMSSISKATQLHESNSLWAFYQEKDHLDCVTIEGQTSYSAKELACMIFEEQPGWIRFLMDLRNRIVSPLGLKTGHEKVFQLDDAANSDQSNDSTVGLFQIFQQSEDEILLGADDWHLDFRVSIQKLQGQVQLASWVRPHNWIGQAYLMLIMPFHHLIVSHSAKRMAKHMAR